MKLVKKEVIKSPIMGNKYAIFKFLDRIHIKHDRSGRTAFKAMQHSQDIFWRVGIT